MILIKERLMLLDLFFVEMDAIRYNPALDFLTISNQRGEMAEWSKAPPWKGGIGATLSRVRIPLSPPPQMMKREVFVTVRLRLRSQAVSFIKFLFQLFMHTTHFINNGFCPIKIITFTFYTPTYWGRINHIA
jgi:hypothetical protein